MFFKAATLVFVSFATLPALDDCVRYDPHDGTYVQPIPEKGPACVATDAILVCDEPVHEFGEVWVGGVLEHEFKVSNIGSELAKVRVHPSLAGTSNWPPVWIEPGQTVGMTLFVQTRKVRRRFAKAITLRLESIRDDYRCLACNSSFDGERHLRRCGPLCPPYEQAPGVRVITD